MACSFAFCFSDPPPSRISTLSLHDALPISGSGNDFVMVDGRHTSPGEWSEADIRAVCARGTGVGADGLDRKSTRLNSSHITISYAVFCLKKKKNHDA